MRGEHAEGIVELWHMLSALIVGLACGLIGLALLRLPDTPMAKPLVAFVATGVSWAVGSLIADAATDLTTKQIGLALLYTGPIALPACWWTLALRWAEEERAHLPFRAAAWTRVPYAFAAAMWLVMITNPWHGAFLTPVVGGRNLYQPFWYVMAVPAYGLILGALAVELAVVARVRTSEVVRQGALLMGASLVTLLGNAAYVSGLIATDVTSVVLSASAALLVLGMAREGLFGVMPAALQEIAANHPDGLVVTGPDGSVRYVNARARSLLPRFDLAPGTPFLDVLRDPRLRPEPPDFIVPRTDAAWAMLARAAGLVFLLDAAPPRWLRISARPVPGWRHRSKGYRVLISDQTEQRKAELRARQTRRLDSVADLARTVSREFQDTFGLVRRNAAMVLDDPIFDAASERKLARIVDAATRGSELAAELQFYSGTVTTQRVVLDLSEIVDECCQMVESDLPALVDLASFPSGRPLPVLVDAIQLRQAIYQLLMNAIDAMDEAQGEIQVWTGLARLDPSEATLVWGSDQPAGDYAYVRIRDEGGGMDPETEERAFEPFFSTRHKERGVGLPTVLGIARAHGAPISLENERGVGCEVTIYFPLDRGETD
jgi:signal transduction histidine kinase